MEIEIYELIEGAKKAKGLCVIIDVFRAFSLEAYLFDKGAEKIFAVGTTKEAWDLKKEDETRILVGERGGKKIEGFDYGNSPSAFKDVSLIDQTIIHTTSAGTQGISSAVQAQEMLVGSFLNARATASYIRAKEPEHVSLVCMGNAGISHSEEDYLCALYLKSLIEGKPFEDLEGRLLSLKESDGKKFFDENQKDVFPNEDFWMCIKHDLFDFVMRCEKENGTYIVHKVPWNLV